MKKNKAIIDISKMTDEEIDDLYRPKKSKFLQKDGDTDKHKETPYMIVKRIVKKAEIIDLVFSDITLLSADEYAKNVDYIPPLNESWWLRTPRIGTVYVAQVDSCGHAFADHKMTYGFDVSVPLSVRPALVIHNIMDSNLNLGDEIVVAVTKWTIISEDLAIANRTIGDHRFRNDYKAPDANDYEKSDVKKYIKNWAKERGIVFDSEKC